MAKLNSEQYLEGEIDVTTKDFINNCSKSLKILAQNMKRHRPWFHYHIPTIFENAKK